MIVYQKFGVIGSAMAYAILQKLKIQIFRLFIIYGDCRNASNCPNLTVSVNNSDDFFENKEVSNFLFKCLIVNNIAAVFPCILLAVWSDKHGRKLLLALPFVGSIIGDLFLFSFLFLPTTPGNVIYLAEGVDGLFGGPMLLSVGCLCYITDSSDHRLRSWLIGIFFGLFNILPVVEMLLQYYWTSFQTQLEFKNLVVIGLSIRIILSAYFLIYVKMYVLESVFVLGSYQGNPWANLLTPINVSDAVNCVFKRRLDNMRFFIIALNTVYLFYSLLLFGNLTVFPQHFRKVFHWSYKSILITAGIFTASQTLALWGSNYVAFKCRTMDVNLGIYGSLSLALSCIVLTFSRNSWLAVAGSLLGIGSLLIPTSIISVLSKLIERAETGSMYAVIGFLMLATQLVSVPSYSVISKICFEADVPQTIFLLSFGFASIGLLFFIHLQRNIAPDLLGHLNPSESLALISRKGQVERLFD